MRTVVDFSEKKRGQIATIVLCGLAALCCVVGCSSEVERQTNATDGGEDVNTATVDVVDDVEEGDTDTGDTDTDDEPWDDWQECDCPSEEEKCTPRLCGLPDAECGEHNGETCPEGYACHRSPGAVDHQICVCVGDEEQCASECSSQDDCPANNRECLFQDGTCHFNTGGCLSSLYCPEGDYCHDDHGKGEPTGDLGFGESCEKNAECHSGICHEGMCDEHCRSHHDCENGTCMWLGPDNNSVDARGCSEYFVSCDAEEHGCEANEECYVGGEEEAYCRPQPCLTTEDCDVGDCVEPRLEMVRQPGRCLEPEESDADQHCKPEEMRIQHDEDRCFQKGSCWHDGHCEEPYTCRGRRCSRDVGEE